MTEISKWLGNLSLAQYVPAFERNDIDLVTIKTLTDGDLQELGVVALGHRKRILLEAETLHQSRPPHDPPVNRAERRHMTVVFCDLVGSTAISTRLDAESLDNVMRTYVEACDKIIRANGGTLAQVHGDGVLAYFGYPCANEDDAERAVRTGFELVGEVSKIVIEGELLRVRIGMATGMAVVGRHWHQIVPDAIKVVGETPNLAARIQSLGQPGEILIAESTRRLLGAHVHVEDRGTHSVNGINRGVRVWRVTDVREILDRFMDSRGALGLTPLVGRKGYLDTLDDVWQNVSVGSGQIAMLRGEAGIGKSRLAHSFFASLDDDAVSLITLQCSPERKGSPLSPLTHHVETEACIEAGDPFDLRVDKLSKLFRHAANADQHARALDAFLHRSGVADPTDLDTSPEKRRLEAFRAITEYLLGLTHAGSVVLLLEDLHWADPTTTTFFAEFASRLSAVPILLLVTSRVGCAKDWPDDIPFTELEVKPLESRHSRTLCMSLSEGQLSAELTDAIIEKGEGNPLFLEELTKAVQATPDDSVSVPDSLRDPLMARIDQLGDAAAIAKVGAVIGREFDLDDLQHLAQIDADDLQSGLDALLTSDLVSAVEVGSRKKFRFKHALIQDAAYDNLLKLEKRPLHHRYANMLSERSEGAAPEIVATHFDLADRPLEAAENWHKAGLVALSNSGNVEALRHIRAGLSAIAKLASVSEHRDLECDLQIALGAAYRAVEGFASPYVETSFTRAMEIIGTENVGTRLLDCNRGLNSCFYIRSDLTSSTELSNRVIDLGCTKSDIRFEMMGRYMLGSTLFWQGSYDGARAELEESIELSSRLEGHADKLSSQINPTAFARLHLAWTLWCLGQGGRSRALIEETLDFAHSLQQPYTMAIALLWASWLGLADDRKRDAERHVYKLATLSDQQGYAYMRTWADGLDGVLHIDQGGGYRGVELILDSVHRLEHEGAHLGLGWLQYWAGHGCQREGRLEESRAHLDDALVRMAKHGSYHWAPQTHALVAEVTRQLPDEASASRDHLIKAVDLARHQHATRFLSSVGLAADAVPAVKINPEY